MEGLCSSMRVTQCDLVTCSACKSEVSSSRLFIAAANHLLQSVKDVKVDELWDSHALQRRTHPSVQPCSETTNRNEIYFFFFGPCKFLHSLVWHYFGDDLSRSLRLHLVVEDHPHSRRIEWQRKRESRNIALPEISTQNSEVQNKRKDSNYY